MSKPLPARRLVALLAAYVVALQALLLPLSVAAGGPLQASLCSASADNAPVKRDNGCPCAAGCGTQCCVQAFFGPPQTTIARDLTRFVAIAPALKSEGVARSPERSPLNPRAPPGA